MQNKSLKLTKCPFCNSSNFKEIIEDRVYEKQGKKVVVPNVPREKCFSCGEQFFGPVACQIIDDFFEKKEKKRKAVND